jgi:riboflavin synthase
LSDGVRSRLNAAAEAAIEFRNMFTGLVEEVGRLEWLRRGEGSAQLALTAPLVGQGIQIGDSVAVNGCCLTVTLAQEGLMIFDLLEETLKKTNLGVLKAGSKVNLERSLPANGRLGGHFVQGHVDTTIALVHLSRQGQDLRLDFELPDEYARFIAYKGSVAINGTSLTVAEVGTETFTVWIIPHTASATNLGELQPGDRVNLECDILSKYTARILEAGRP